jgi:ribonuclease Z
MEAAEIAKEANVKKLLLGHYSARYRTLQPLLDEAQLVFPNTELSVEGKWFLV